VESKTPNWLYWTVEHPNNSPKKTGYNLTKRKESLRKKEEM